MLAFPFVTPMHQLVLLHAHQLKVLILKLALSFFRRKTKKWKISFGHQLKN